MDVILFIRRGRIFRMAEKLLELRNNAKKVKPRFVVKESKFSARVKSRWRFPRGKHSKVRQMHKGRPALPSTGFGSPKEVRGLHSSGLEMVVVHNRKDLESLDAQKQGAVISGKVGKKKKMELLALAAEKKITVLNVKDLSKEIEKIKGSFEERKKLKKERLSKASKKEEEKKKEHDHDHEHEHEHEKTEESKQKKMIEKTITKKQ